MASWGDLDDNNEEELAYTSMGMDLWGVIDFGVVEWVDGPWRIILQRCLTKLWDMFHEQNHGRVTDREVHHMEHENATKDVEDVKKKLIELEEQCKMELKMEKMGLTKEQRCILTSQANITRNTRKSTKEAKEDRDVLQEEKKKLRSVIVELVKGGHGRKEKLEKIKSILEEYGGILETTYIVGIYITCHGTPRS
ncbi:hypothetical protein ZWY2020_038726 [Hordeum vulgare]|nr:hypothetical protein ZWY2020_038726 [Hordeum vulgare]